MESIKKANWICEVNRETERERGRDPTVALRVFVANPLVAAQCTYCLTDALKPIHSSVTILFFFISSICSEPVCNQDSPCLTYFSNDKNRPKCVFV